MTKDERDVIRSALSVAEREGKDTNWEALGNRLRWILEHEPVPLLVQPDQNEMFLQQESPNDKMSYSGMSNAETYYKCSVHDVQYPFGAKCPMCISQYEVGGKQP